MDTQELSKESIDFLVLPNSELETALAHYKISLSINDGKRLQEQILKRPPTVTECQLWAIEGSEHCSYKSSKNWLQTLPTKAPHLIVGVGEDAAVVSVARSNDGIRYGIAISHESHNHPSQVVPFEGAATGVGGNVRDVNCMGAQVVALADILRFGDIDNDKTQWLNQEVVNGISAYGNALGIPNIAGDVAYDSSYMQNCLVNVVTLGIVREDKVIHSYVPANADGYALILVGKPTDNSGFGGASFASNTLNESDANRGAVQEPNAFLERHLIKANNALIQRLDEEGHLSRVAFKDLGAGGVGCASVEIADGNGFGAEVFLDDVPTSMEGLHPSVILCAETQERFMWALPQDLVPLVLEHYNETYDLPGVSSGAKASVVGRITEEKNYVVWANGVCEVHANAVDVTAGLSEDRQIKTPEQAYQPVAQYDAMDNVSDAFVQVVCHENCASHKPIYDQYDKQVQGRTIVERGQANAGVIAPFQSAGYPSEINDTGVALAVNHVPLKNHLSPYLGAQDAIFGAVEALASVGAKALGITDCLCYGDPSVETHMWAFSEGVRGIKDACLSYSLYQEPEVTLPVLGGNVSFYNTTDNSAIAPSPIIGSLGVMDDVAKVMTPAFKADADVIYVLRDEHLSLAGSVYSSLYPVKEQLLTELSIARIQARTHFVLEAIEKESLSACININRGGLATALLKMSLGSQYGFHIHLDEKNLVTSLFAESGGFVLTANDSQVPVLEALAKSRGLSLQQIGQTCKAATLQVNQAICLDKAQLATDNLATLQEVLL